MKIGSENRFSGKTYFYTSASRQRTRAAAATVKRLREESPAKFCAAASAFFLALACVGSRVTALGLAYFVAVGSLVLPGVARGAIQSGHY